MFQPWFEIQRKLSPKGLPQRGPAICLNTFQQLGLGSGDPVSPLRSFRWLARSGLRKGAGDLRLALPIPNYFGGEEGAFGILSPKESRKRPTLLHLVGSPLLPVIYLRFHFPSRTMCCRATSRRPQPQVLFWTIGVGVEALCPSGGGGGNNSNFGARNPKGVPSKRSTPCNPIIISQLFGSGMKPTGN